MDKLPLPNRRAVIKSSAAALACALPIPALAAEPAASDARLHSLMIEWRTEYDAVCHTAGALSNAHMARLYAIEQQAAAIRPVTLQGFAIKLVMLTNYGEHDLDGPAAGLVAEAEAIAGYAPPAAFKRG